MRRWFAVIGLVALAACSSGKDNPQPKLAPQVTTAPEAVTTTAAPVSDFKVGDRVETKSHYFLTVAAVADNVMSADDIPHPAAGKRFYAVEVNHCAADAARFHDPSGTGPDLLQLQMPDNSRVDAYFLGIKEPELKPGSQFTGPNDCIRGWVTFQVPVGQKPAYVLASPQDDNGQTYIIRWRIP